MARKLRQFRYYNDNSKLNQPAQLNKAKLISGSIFQESIPIYQIGIQTLPGTKFYLNNCQNPIIVNSSGIYELSVENQTTITSITFSQGSLETIDKTQGYLIIDILGGEEE